MIPAELSYGHTYRVFIPEGETFPGLPCIPADPRNDHCRLAEVPNLALVTYTGPQQIEDFTMHVFEYDGYKVMLGEGALAYVKKIYQKKR